jgi:hypothetical protein
MTKQQARRAFYAALGIDPKDRQHSTSLDRMAAAARFEAFWATRRKPLTKFKKVAA